MAVDMFTPEGMLRGAPYHHVAVATGARQVHVAGQVGGDENGDVAPGDLTAQVAQTMRNTARGLAAAGATFHDVVRLTFYVAGWQPEQIEGFMAGVASVADELDLPMPMPPSSLIGVAMLFSPEVLVEVEATAILE